MSRKRIFKNPAIRLENKTIKGNKYHQLSHCGPTASPRAPPPSRLKLSSSVHSGRQRHPDPPTAQPPCQGRGRAGSVTTLRQAVPPREQVSAPSSKTHHLEISRPCLFCTDRTAEGKMCFGSSRRRPGALATQTQGQGAPRPRRGAPSLAKGQVCITGLSSYPGGIPATQRDRMGKFKEHRGKFLVAAQ